MLCSKPNRSSRREEAQNEPRMNANTEQAAKPEHHRNAEVVAMRECLDFMLLVEEGLSGKTESLERKARELENAFYA